VRSDNVAEGEPKTFGNGYVRERKGGERLFSQWELWNAADPLPKKGTKGLLLDKAATGREKKRA
jgi:hypothetical protein